jgi:hypothetical protein
MDYCFITNLYLDLLIYLSFLALFDCDFLWIKEPVVGFTKRMGLPRSMSVKICCGVFVK